MSRKEKPSSSPIRISAHQVRGKVKTNRSLRTVKNTSADSSYLAGQIKMYERYKFENIIEPAQVRRRIKRLSELFVISADLEGKDWLLTLDSPLRERYEFLIQNRYRRNPDLLAAEDLAGLLRTIVETPLLHFPPTMLERLESHERPSLPHVYKICFDLRKTLEPYLKRTTEPGDTLGKNAGSRLARIFSNVCAIYEGAQIKAEPHGKAWTCRYRDPETGMERRVPIAVAAIEGAFILTRESFQLPKKKRLWKWMEENVLEGRKTNDQMKAQILETAMLAYLKEDHKW